MKRDQGHKVHSSSLCNGLWELHLSSLNAPCKYLFAYDKQKYARLVPLYLAEMTALQSTDPDIHPSRVHWYKLCSQQKPNPIGVNRAPAHINRIMKVTGGLVGITQNASARERFFLTAPELSRLAEEVQMMAGSPTTTRQEHHDLSLAVWYESYEVRGWKPAQYHHYGCDASWGAEWYYVQPSNKSMQTLLRNALTRIRSVSGPKWRSVNWRHGKVQRSRWNTKWLIM